MERYDAIAHSLVETDRELGVQLVAMLHHMAGLDLRVDPGVGRAREFQAALRAALADLESERPDPL